MPTKDPTLDSKGAVFFYWIIYSKMDPQFKTIIPGWHMSSILLYDDLTRLNDDLQNSGWIVNTLPRTEFLLLYPDGNIGWCNNKRDFKSHSGEEINFYELKYGHCQIQKGNL